MKEITRNILKAIKDCEQAPLAIYLGIEQLQELLRIPIEEKKHIRSTDGVYAEFDEIEIIPVSKENYLRVI